MLSPSPHIYSFSKLSFFINHLLPLLSPTIFFLFCHQPSIQSNIITNKQTKYSDEHKPPWIVLKLVLTRSTQASSMDSLFQLGIDSDHANYISTLLHSLGFSYVSLWLHSSPQNYLQCSYGYYPGDYLREQQPSSSYGSRASRLFDEYRLQTTFIIDQADVVPGLAFKRSRTLILREFELQQLASSDIQRQFYLEARIKTAVFMGCRSGEIELGFSVVPQNLELELRKIFHEDFQSMDLPFLHIPSSLQDPQQQSRPSSSSSRSIDSAEYPSFLYNLSTMRETPLIIKQQNPPNPFTNQGFPTPESVDAALTNAFIASLTPPISPSTVSSLPPRSPLDRFNRRGELSAFKSCGSTRIRQGFKALSSGLTRQNMLKKVLSFYRGLNIRRIQQHQAFQNQEGRLSHPTSNQLHHVMSERKRREKINESFQALRSLLPSGTKKDKATVLRITKEYMRSLRDQIPELNRRNKLLESQISLQGGNVEKNDIDTVSSGTSEPNINERVHVQLIHVTESSSMGEQRMDLRVSVQGDGTSIIDLVMQLLDFLKGVHEVRLGSMDARSITTSFHEEHQTQPQLQQHQQRRQQHSINRVTLRLTIEGNEWDQSAFLEAVRRVVDNLAH